MPDLDLPRTKSRQFAIRNRVGEGWRMVETTLTQDELLAALHHPEDEVRLASPQGLFAKPRFVGQNWNIRHAPAPTGLASDLFATCDQPVT